MNKNIIKISILAIIIVSLFSCENPKTSEKANIESKTIKYSPSDLLGTWKVVSISLPHLKQNDFNSESDYTEYQAKRKRLKKVKQFEMEISFYEKGKLMAKTDGEIETGVYGVVLGNLLQFTREGKDTEQYEIFNIKGKEMIWKLLNPDYPNQVLNMVLNKL